jgi:hypothetical protein
VCNREKSDRVLTTLLECRTWLAKRWKELGYTDHQPESQVKPFAEVSYIPFKADVSMFCLN